MEGIRHCLTRGKRRRRRDGTKRMRQGEKKKRLVEEWEKGINVGNLMGLIGDFQNASCTSFFASGAQSRLAGIMTKLLSPTCPNRQL